ncbi:unnamed protein product [Closterium sp. Naga37s-1]|nr:unnamed protein product [Closterium sp. Naga37s-1]CAI5521701.1 unnamed protein product [Closterium sp. Naga37s-1]
MPPKANLQTSLSLPLALPAQGEGRAAGVGGARAGSKAAALSLINGPSLQPSSLGLAFSARPCPLSTPAPPYASATTATTAS